MSDHLPTHPSSPAPEHLVPVHEAARILGDSPALFTALIEGELVEGALIDGIWHVDTGVVAAAPAVRNPLQNTPINGPVKLVDGAA